jgi:hypothetical protein
VGTLDRRGERGEDGVAGDNRKPAKEGQHAPSEEDALKPGGKPDGAKPGGTKPDGAKPDGAKADGAKADGAKSDGAKADGAKSGGAKPGERPATPPDAVDLRAQLPYFAARFAVFVVIAVVLIVLGVAPLFAVVFGLASAGVLTWPLGRMQRRAARRAARRPPGK